MRGMLDAYERRSGDMPVPGSEPPPYRMAREFAEKFGVCGIDIAGGRGGTYGIYVGHPSECNAPDLGMPYHCTGVHSAKTALGSSGNVFGHDTLARSLPSLWSVWSSLRSGGNAVLLAECGGGLGSEALVRCVEGNLDLRRPDTYVQGMEDVLFAQTIIRDTEVILVTTLPDLYVERLGVTPARQVQSTIDSILKENPRRKVSVLPDAGRSILQDPGRKRGTDDG